MPYQSCFGQHWKIPQFKSVFRKKKLVSRPDEKLVLGDGAGSVVKIAIHLEPIRDEETHNMEMYVTMLFHDISAVNKDIKIDFFVVCGDFHHYIYSTMTIENIVDGIILSRNYECFKENLDTDPSLTPNDTLTLAVRFSICPPIVQVPLRKAPHLDRNPIVDLERLFDDDKFADFVFSVQDVEFKVHKAIIAIRSSVFEAMMEHDMKEKSDNRAEITDLDPTAFKEMLRYVYTGKVENLANVVGELIKIADKYDLPGLKNTCEDHLSEGLCPDNAIDLLKQADMFNCERLKAQSLEYIVQNVVRVGSSDAWKGLESHLPAKLICEICYGLSKGNAEIRCEPFRSDEPSRVPKRRISSSESDSDSSSDDVTVRQPVVRFQPVVRVIGGPPNSSSDSESSDEDAEPVLRRAL